MEQMYIGAIDQGTTSSRVIVFDSRGKIVHLEQEEFPQYFPRPGWVEHDPWEIFASVRHCLDRVAKTGIKLQAIGITNQRETTLAWSAVTGLPLYNAIVWQDTRTSDYVHEFDQDQFRGITGLPVATYFSALKIKWMLENVPAVQKAAKDNSLRVGTVDSWLIYNLSKAKMHVTDVTNASRTMLMDLSTLKWSPLLLKEFGIDESWLPEILPSSGDFGSIEIDVMHGTKIGGCIGDQQGSLFGQLCFKTGQVKNTYGTGCFMLMNVGEKPKFSTHGLITTVGYQIRDHTCYAIEGSIAIAGSAVRWFRDQMGLIKKASDIETLASEVQSTQGVHFVPAFSGLFAPHWRDDARGVIVGLSYSSSKNHLARAVLEAVAFQAREILDAMNADSGNDTIHALRVDGGMTSNDLLMQIQADLAGIPIERPAMRETTALGAALLAGLASGVYASCEQIVATLDRDGLEAFAPSISETESNNRLKTWKKAVERSFGWQE